MAKLLPSINALNAGEWDSTLVGRYDLEKYSKACRRMENFLPQKHGGAKKRHGFEHLAIAKHYDETEDEVRDTAPSRLVPFEYDEQNAFLLQFGDKYLRFWGNGELISGDNIFRSNFAYGTSGWSGSNVTLAGRQGAVADAQPEPVSKTNPLSVTDAPPPDVAPYESDFSIDGSDDGWIAAAGAIPPTCSGGRLRLGRRLQGAGGYGHRGVDTGSEAVKLTVSVDYLFSSGGNAQVYLTFADGTQEIIANVTAGIPATFTRTSAFTKPLHATRALSVSCSAPGDVYINSVKVSYEADGKHYTETNDPVIVENEEYYLNFSYYIPSGNPICKSFALYQGEARVPDSAILESATGHTSTLFDVTGEWVAVSMLVKGQPGNARWRYYMLGEAGAEEWTGAQDNALYFADHAIQKRQPHAAEGLQVIEAKTPYSAEDVFGLKFFQSFDVIYLCHPKYPVHKLSRRSNTYWTLDPVDWKFPAFNDWNTSELTLTASAVTGSNVTLTASNELFELGHVGGHFMLEHPRDDVNRSYQWTVSQQTAGFSVQGNWTLTTRGSWSGEVKVRRSYDRGKTWSDYRIVVSRNDNNESITGTESEPVFLRIEFNRTGGTVSLEVTIEDYFHRGFVLVREVISPVQAIVDVVRELGSTEPTADWAEGAWCPKNGFPAAAALYGQRVYYGSGDSVYGSVVGDYENFERTGLDDSSLRQPLPIRNRNRITWLVAEDEVIVGTTGGVFSIPKPNNDEAITPGNVRAKHNNAYDCGAVDAVFAGDALLMTQREDRILRELSYSLDSYKYTAPTDLTLLASHITGDGITQAALQQHPLQTYWAVRRDGQLISLIYERGEEVIGWARHAIAESEFVSVAIAPAQSGLGEDIWAVVRHNSGGESIYSVLRMHTEETAANTITLDLDGGGLERRVVDYLDHYVVRRSMDEDPPIAGTIDGLDHLEGNTVVAFGDGRVDGEYVVEGGAITIAGEYSDLRIGVPYTALLQTMDFEFGLEGGSTQTQRKAVSGFTVKVHESAYVVGGTREGHLIPLPQEPLQTDAPQGLYTGNLRCDAYSGNREAVSVIISSPDPFPAHVIGIYPLVRVSQ